MKQISIDLRTLPEVDGFKHLIVCIDYFSKWSEAKAVKDKSAPTVAKFLYEIICPHGCMRMQINDQGKEFVNEVSENFHEMTGTEQRITSAYHPRLMAYRSAKIVPSNELPLHIILSLMAYQRFLGKSSGEKAERMTQCH